MNNEMDAPETPTEPPAYVPVAPASAPESTSATITRHRTITDLREQILINASTVIPATSDGQVEVLVAMNPATAAGAAFSSPEELANAGKHYAVLIKQPFKKVQGNSVQVIFKGKAKATPEEALEYLLTTTEEMVHDLMKRYTTPATGINPGVMHWLSRYTID